MLNNDILKRLIQLEKAASTAPWEMDVLDAREAETVHCVMYNSDKSEGKPIFDSSNSEDQLITDESDESGPHYRDDVAFNNFLFIKGMRNYAKELLAMAAENEKLRKIASHVPGDVYIKAKEDAGFAEAIQARREEAFVINIPPTKIFDKRLDEEASALQTVQERDDAEQALSQAYFLVTGRSPEWSSTWHHQECLDEIRDACTMLREEIKSRPFLTYEDVGKALSTAGVGLWDRRNNEPGDHERSDLAMENALADALGAIKDGDQ
jgi:hypothetical protein